MVEGRDIKVYNVIKKYVKKNGDISVYHTKKRYTYQKKIKGISKTLENEMKKKIASECRRVLLNMPLEEAQRVLDFAKK